MRKHLFIALAITSALSALPTMTHADDIKDSDVFNMSLQQLADIDVTSVSKRTEKASQTAAALYVITQEDIRRSGLQNIPELLRMVPGLEVAQSSSGGWAVTSRGFNSQFADKLLVLIDGRTVYTPVFGGVAWDMQNTMLEDIDRIEVIRGPGATLWGANAVNGVINIITKNSKDTQGTLLTTAAGTQERFASGARYGGTAGDLSYRTYGQYFDYNQQHTLTGTGAGDPWDNGQGGFRMDWNGHGKDTGTLQGDAYRGQENLVRLLPVTSTVSPTLFNVVNDTDRVSGVNVLGRWKHEFTKDSDITLQAYYDDVNREYELMGASFHVQTADFDFQHNWVANDWNNITWGGGYRRIDIYAGNSFYVSFMPQNYYENLYNGFLQDKISIVQDKLFLTLGSKLEHNDFTGFELEPSARISWLPSDRHTLWAAVSRAVHTPTPATENTILMLRPAANTPTELIAEQGNINQVSEELIAYEAGYRVQPQDNISFDVTAFYDDYSKLVSTSPGTPTPLFNPIMGNYVYVPLIIGNANNGETHGMEFASTWEVTPKIKLNGSYSFYFSHLNIIQSSLVTQSGTSPNQQFSLRSYVDLPYNLQWDTMIYHVNSLPAIPVPAYNRLDMRLGWTPVNGLDLSIIGQNLLKSEHQEFSPLLYQSPEEVSRSVLAKATLRF